VWLLHLWLLLLLHGEALHWLLPLPLLLLLLLLVEQLVTGVSSSGIRPCSVHQLLPLLLVVLLLESHSWTCRCYCEATPLLLLLPVSR
jgi:hypothetical protein